MRNPVQMFRDWYYGDGEERKLLLGQLKYQGDEIKSKSKEINKELDKIAKKDNPLGELIHRMRRGDKGYVQ